MHMEQTYTLRKMKTILSFRIFNLRDHRLFSIQLLSLPISKNCIRYGFTLTEFLGAFMHLVTL